jgi:anti-sigma regulatory factor (Ser/Thr protein kinase)
MAVFPRIATFIAEMCGTAGFERPDCLRLTLVVEELFSNTVRHGHGGDCDEPVSLTFTIETGRIALTYEDTAPPFDLLAAVGAVEGATWLEDRPLGGLGVVLITRLTKDLEYGYIHGRNRVSLVVITSP